MRLDTRQARDLLRRHENRREFEGTARLGVLQHRSLEGTELLGHLIARLGAVADRTPDRHADLRCFVHDRRREASGFRVREDQIAGRAGHRRWRVHGHVAPELEPDVPSHVFAAHGVEAAGAECIRDVGHAMGQGVRDRTDDEPVAHHVVRTRPGSTTQAAACTTQPST